MDKIWLDIAYVYMYHMSTCRPASGGPQKNCDGNMYMDIHLKIYIYVYKYIYIYTYIYVCKYMCVL